MCGPRGDVFCRHMMASMQGLLTMVPFWWGPRSDLSSCGPHGKVHATMDLQDPFFLKKSVLIVVVTARGSQTTS
jgi:hypothetical protein